MRLGILLTSLLCMSAVGTASDYFYSGTELTTGVYEYQKYLNGEKAFDGISSVHYMGFVTGLYDTYSLNGTICPATETDLTRITSRVATFLIRNSDRGQEPAAALVKVALKQAFPCPS